MRQDKIWEYYQNELPEVFIESAGRLKFLAARVKKHIGLCGSSKVLNIGVGAGVFEEIAAQMGLEIYSLDPSVRSIESLRLRLGMDSRAQTGRVEKMPFADDFFGAVVASEVFEHLPSPVLYSALDEIKRVLAKEGFIFGTVPARENLTEQIVVCPDCGKKFHRWGHSRSFDPPGLARLLSLHFRITEMIERPFFNWGGLERKRKVLAILRLCAWRCGIHSSNETIYFCGRKR